MIVSMKRMTLVAHKADETAILNALQAMRAVEVISNGQENGAQAALECAQSRLQQIGDALKTIHPYTQKKSFFAAPAQAKAEELFLMLPDAVSLSEQLTAINRELAATKSEIEKNETLIEALRPWQVFPADMQRYQLSKKV
jgi:vacuolar-type H+-ATPase subunit I/STV1